MIRDPSHKVRTWSAIIEEVDYYIFISQFELTLLDEALEDKNDINEKRVKSIQYECYFSTST